MDSSNARVLIAEDGRRARMLYADVLRRAGHRVDTAAAAAELLERLRGADYDLITLDLGLSDGQGLDLLRSIKKLHPSLLVVLMGADPAPHRVIEGFRSGAYDFLLRPVMPDALRRLVARAKELKVKGAQRQRLSQELAEERMRVLQLERRLDTEDPFERIVGSSATVRGLVDSLREVALTESTVLLTGESGTGKGLAARAIHDASERRHAPFVEANCVVYSEGLLHSELFGHEKGAFTGANRQKKGRFEMARGGTVFLDEIGEIAHGTQLLLLRVLQDRTFERVGGEQTLEADVRLIAATNRDLELAIERGDFRSDLYYRLNVIPVRIPPLREHPDDIPVLAQHFLRRAVTRMDREVEAISGAALDALVRHPWPGNVRELENVIERMVVLSRGRELGVADLPTALALGAETAPAPAGHGTLQDLEARRIGEVLRETGGNKKLAAQRLGIHRSTLYTKLKRYGIDPDACRETRHAVSDGTTRAANTSENNNLRRRPA